MPVVYPCPLCGRSVNRRGRPLDEPGKTKSHIDGAHDDRHKDERGEDHMDAIRNNAVEVDAAELPTTEDKPTPTNGAEPTVEIIGEEMPLTAAVELNSDMIMAPEDFGIASEEQIRELNQSVGELNERIDDLTPVVEILATESDLINGECPDCSGHLEIVTEGVTAFSKRRYVACERCERRVSV